MAQRRRFTPQFKAEVVIEALMGLKFTSRLVFLWQSLCVSGYCVVYS